MSITDAQAVSFGLLVMYAEDMYTPGALKPALDPRILAAGWTVVSYLTAHDAVFPADTDADRTLDVSNTARVFFGFVAQNNTDHSYVAVIRGTDGIVEWVIDAEFVLIPHPRHAGVRIEQGFWNIYQTLSLANPSTGVTTYQNAAEGIAALVGAGTVVVAGHSLGSALATYLTDDLADRLGPRATACLFASPRTGDPAWANLFDTNVTSYRVFNYILDIVTHVPSLDYATLGRATVVQPATAQAGICLDVLCNHHVLCYCAMIDYPAVTAAAAASLPSTTGTCNQPCILGGAATVPASAKALATIINDFGIGDARSMVMLKALHEIGKI
jgi:hypothetical protein